MYIDDFNKKKRDLERELVMIIHERLKKFSYETGLYPYEINIDIDDITSVSDNTNKRIVSDVSCEFDYDNYIKGVSYKM